MAPTGLGHGCAAHRIYGAAIDTIIPRGTEGVVVSPLRTSGRVRFGDRLIDAQSVGAYIDRGDRVRVVTADDFGVKVERIEP